MKINTKRIIMGRLLTFKLEIRVGSCPTLEDLDEIAKEHNLGQFASTSVRRVRAYKHLYPDANIAEAWYYVKPLQGDKYIP